MPKAGKSGTGCRAFVSRHVGLVRCQKSQWLRQIFCQKVGAERHHAERIIKHLTDLGERAARAQTGIQNVARSCTTGAAHEHASTLGVNPVYKAALDAKDYPVQLVHQRAGRGRRLVQ